MTNFEKITQSAQTLAEVLKDCQERFYCGQCPAYDFCKGINGMIPSECYEIIKQWLESEVVEND